MAAGTPELHDFEDLKAHLDEFLISAYVERRGKKT